MSVRLSGLSLALAAFAMLGSSARAQTLSLSLQRETKHGTFGLSIGSDRFGAYCPSVPPTCQEPRGSFEIIEEKIWVPGRQTRVWVQPVHETWYDACGNPHSYLVRPGYWKTVCEPGRWEIVQRRVWIPNYRPSSRIVWKGY